MIIDVPNIERIIIMGDLNARMENDIVLGVKEHFSEELTNHRGVMRTELCAHNELVVNNTYFQHKPQHKYI